MKKWRRWCVLGLSAIMVCGAAACTPNPDDKGNGGGSGEELSIYIWSSDGQTPAGFDGVLKHFNDTYADDLGFKVKFKFDTQSDYKQNLNLAMAAGESDYDMVFDAGWIYLNDFAKKKYYYDLGEFFKEDSQYKGLSAAFSQDYLNSNLFSNGVYGIPLTETYGEVSVAYIRKDWREECAADTSFKMPAGKFEDSSVTVTNASLADGIDTFDELQYYLYWIKTNKSEATPCLTNKDATWGAWDIINARNKPVNSAADFANAGIKREIKLTPDVTATACISKRGEVQAAYINDVEDPNSVNGLTSFPTGFNKVDETWKSNFQRAKTWSDDGIISADVLNESDASAKFNAGMGGCVVQTISNFATVESALQKSTPGAELEIFVSDYTVRNKLKGYAQTDFKAWNFLCVPVSAGEAKRDMALKFMNWIFEDEEHHDLFQYGIKGTHWELAKDENGMEIEGTVSTTGMEAYAFPAYELTWNPNFIRLRTASDPKVLEYMRYMYDADRYVKIPYAEFTFDHTANSELTNALANATLTSAKGTAVSWYLGQKPDPVTTWQAELEKRYTNANAQAACKTIKNELIEQLQAYIDNLDE